MKTSSIEKYLKPSDGILVLEDGSSFSGRLIGDRKKAFGEVVFNTSMTGYQEVLTDPSYTDQIVVMTYPHQGNYGINSKDQESEGGIKAAGFVVNSCSEFPSNFASEESLNGYLVKNKITALEGIDTREVTMAIRNKGAMRGLVFSQEEFKKSCPNGHLDIKKLFESLPSYSDTDLIMKVSTKTPYWYNKAGSKTVVVLDFGVKLNLLREISNRDCKVVVLPANATKEVVESYKPDGIFLSNGPGDPSLATYAVRTVKEILGSKPVFGVCMGHQILGLALGGKTFKMKFGHRGANQPVWNVQDERVEISSHNHGFAVDPASLPLSVKVTHLNLNDQTCEGLESLELKAFSVQYHPESAPGPHDSEYLFDKFTKQI